MENAPVIINGSLTVGPMPAERAGRGQTPASDFLMVLLEGLGRGPAGREAVKRGRPWLGTDSLCDSFFGASREVVRTEPAALPAEAPLAEAPLAEAPLAEARLREARLVEAPPAETVQWADTRRKEADTRREEIEEPVELEGEAQGPVGEATAGPKARANEARASEAGASEVCANDAPAPDAPAPEAGEADEPDAEGPVEGDREEAAGNAARSRTSGSDADADTDAGRELEAAAGSRTEGEELAVDPLGKEAPDEDTSAIPTSVPGDLHSPRVMPAPATPSGTPAEAGEGAPERAPEAAPVVVVEGEGLVLQAPGAPEPSPVVLLSASADAVSGAVWSSGADGAETGADDEAANAFSGGMGPLQALAAPEGDIVEKLDAAFDEILSATPLPRTLQARIELARSIGRQVIRDAVVSVRNGRMEVVLQLRPPGLGSVRMQLGVEGKTVSAKLSVDNALVREVVEHYLPQLRSVLRQEGFILDRFEVSVRARDGGDSWASAQADGQGRGEGRASMGGRDELPGEGTDEATAGIEARVASVHDGTVDYLA